jgi:hypothetical protein
MNELMHDLMKENAELRRQLDLVTGALEGMLAVDSELDAEIAESNARAALAAVRKLTERDSEAELEAVMDAVADALGDAYDCIRVWEAWFVGTMSQDDFIRVVDSGERLAEIASAAISAMRKTSGLPAGEGCAA